MIELLNELASRAMESVAQGNIGAMGALFFVSALTEVGVPFPFIMDSILFFSGYQTGPVTFEVLRIIIVLLLGRVAGSSVIYWSSRLLGRSFLLWAGRRSSLLRHRLRWLADKLSCRAPLAVAIARLTPGLLTPSSVVSGTICLPYPYFVTGIALSSLIADSAIIILGFVTRSGVDYLGFTPSLWHIILGIVAVIIIVWALRHILVRSR